MTLAGKSCVPCRGGIPPLTGEVARKLASDVAEWELNEEATRISRSFAFKDFKEALGFVNRVGELAEAEGHHPDFSIHWNTVDLVLWTHKIGGLHENDFIMAAKIDQL